MPNNIGGWGGNNTSRIVSNNPFPSVTPPVNIAPTQQTQPTEQTGRQSETPASNTEAKANNPTALLECLIEACKAFGFEYNPNNPLGQGVLKFFEWCGVPGLIPPSKEPAPQQNPSQQNPSQQNPSQQNPSQGTVV
ncbi:MAG: hypothetical protein ACK44C_03020 [Polaromonas sp.]|jgi:hypothetical protein